MLLLLFRSSRLWLTLAFLLLLLLLLLLPIGFLRLGCVEARCGHIFTEGDCTEDTSTRGHLEQDRGVTRDVLEGAVTSLFVEHELEADCHRRDEQGIGQRHLMANEEVAECEVAVDGCQGLLQLIQSNRESTLVRACLLARDHVDHPGGSWSHISLNIVDPSVDLHLYKSKRLVIRLGTADAFVIEIDLL